MMSKCSKFGALPVCAQKYKETRVFTEVTIPAGFTREHATKDGVWGKICVVKGALELTVYEPTKSTLELSEGEFAVAAPKQSHSVKLAEGAAFMVEFYTIGATKTAPRADF